MANPVLNDKTFSGERAVALQSEAQASGAVMTIDGTIGRGLVLFALLVVGGVVGWITVGGGQGTAPVFPTWLLIPMFGSLIVGMITAFVPKIAPVTAPIYTLGYGIVVGAVSAVYEAFYSGIVLQAVLVTGAVFAVMLALYTSRTIRVTPRLRLMIFGATLGVLLVYLGSWIVSLFGVSVPFFGNGWLGIGFSVLVAGVAAFNLLLDFDMIEQGSKMGAPRYYSWYCAWALMVTLIWLYLTILRLLAIVSGRR
ncbi:MAG: Bax inhibitor-1/YccA family protein [Acidimicrobiia bacterium]